MYLQANHVGVDRVAPHDIFIIFSLSRKKDSCQIALYCFTYSDLTMNFGHLPEDGAALGGAHHSISTDIYSEYIY